ncbi:MAG: MbtH family NRPS accessory protein [Actinomycetota bacterium]
MSLREKEKKMIYKGVVKHEEQYSIWPASRESVPGWKDPGKEPAKRECLAHTKDAWTDMRPPGVPKKMENLQSGNLQ